MGKRKNEDSAERIRRKIRKLNEKLKKRRIIYSDEDSSPLIHTEDVDQEQCDSARPLSEPVSEVEATPGCSHELEPEPVPVLPNLPDTVEETDLDTDILAILGEAPEPETKLGGNIHKDVAARWLEIIKKGLNKDVKGQLASEYLVPGNCELLVPPLLNPEAKAALTEPFLKRDSSLMYRQKQISNALAALAPVIEIVISKNFDHDLKQKLLKPVSDASRILCDMYHNETKMRKKFVISSISTGLRDTLVNSSTDKYLFGDNMSDKIKNAKNVQRSGEALRVTQKTQKPNYNTNSYNSNRKNFKPLHQRVAGKKNAGKSQPGYRQYQPQSGRAAPHRAGRERSPPPPPSPPPRRTRNAQARR